MPEKNPEYSPKDLGLDPDVLRSPEDLAEAEQYHYLFGGPKEGASKKEVEIYNTFNERYNNLQEKLRDEQSKDGYNDEDLRKLDEIFQRKVARVRADRDESLAELYEDQGRDMDKNISKFKEEMDKI